MSQHQLDQRPAPGIAGAVRRLLLRVHLVVLLAQPLVPITESGEMILGAPEDVSFRLRRHGLVRDALMADPGCRLAVDELDPERQLAALALQVQRADLGCTWGADWPGCDLGALIPLGPAPPGSLLEASAQQVGVLAGDPAEGALPLGQVVLDQGCLDVGAVHAKLAGEIVDSDGLILHLASVPWAEADPLTSQDTR